MPDARMSQFIGVNLAKILPDARKQFSRHKNLLINFGSKEISYENFKTQIKQIKAQTNEKDALIP